MAALRAIRIERVPAEIDSYARGALWTANDTFRSFSVHTLRAVVAAWLAALFLWAVTRHRSTEWIASLYCAVFIIALAYDTTINYVASHGETTSPSARYTQVLVVPMLALAVLGTSRSGKAGKVVTISMVLPFGYILVAAYWAKPADFLFTSFLARRDVSGSPGFASRPHAALRRWYGRNGSPVRAHSCAGQPSPGRTLRRIALRIPARHLRM